jgi:hypothetical protein
LEQRTVAANQELPAVIATSDVAMSNEGDSDDPEEPVLVAAVLVRNDWQALDCANSTSPTVPSAVATAKEPRRGHQSKLCNAIERTSSLPVSGIIVAVNPTFLSSAAAAESENGDDGFQASDQNAKRTFLSALNLREQSSSSDVNPRPIHGAAVEKLGGGGQQQVKRRRRLAVRRPEQEAIGFDEPPSMRTAVPGKVKIFIKILIRQS